MSERPPERVDEFLSPGEAVIFCLWCFAFFLAEIIGVLELVHWIGWL